MPLWSACFWSKSTLGVEEGDLARIAETAELLVYTVDENDLAPPPPR